MNRLIFGLLVVSTLVLVTGERIDVAGPIQDDGNRLVFRTTGGTLYSLAVDEVDLAATRRLEEQRRKAAAPAAKKLKVTPEERDRLLAELAKNHEGQAPDPQQMLESPPPAPTARERAAEQDDEWRWRREMRAYEEGVRRAQENLQLLLDRAEQLENEIRGFLSLGYTPRQFTYQTTILA
ncbi:MAG TPA: hypothetical protein VF057_13490, partial [Thermoanaerobaculia bacterium]